MYTRNHENYKKRGHLVLVLSLLCLSFTTDAFADRWQVMTFTENLEQDFAAFNEFCFLHDLSSADVLWANSCTMDEIIPGTQIRLPVSQVDLLALWQNRGAWQPEALVPVTSAALAERARSEQSNQSSQQPVIQTPVAKPDSAPESASKPVPIRQTPVDAIADITARSSEIELPKAQSKGPAPTPVTSTKPKNQSETVKTNPVLVLHPDGDANTGPMRLVISGGQVQVVRLPKEATPKTPSLSDLNQPLSTSMLFDIMNPANTNSSKPGVQIPTGSKMMWPVSGKVTSGFGPRWGKRHDGLDMPMPTGTEIHAAQDGRVLLTGTNTTPGFRGYGNFALIDHGKNICTLYAHCQTVKVQKGQQVRKGQVIATVGDTGRTTTAHVHFEVRVNGKAVDPIPYLAKR